MRAVEIAKCIVNMCHDLNLSITNLKLQKLLYFAQGHYEQINDEKLLNEDFEAWIHGPVLYDVYREFKRYSWSEIPKQTSNPVCKEKEKFFKHLLEAYGKKAASVLEDISHEEAPWINARTKLSPSEPSRNKINYEDIKNYYHNTKGGLDEQIDRDRSYRSNLSTDDKILADLLGI